MSSATGTPDPCANLPPTARRPAIAGLAPTTPGLQADDPGPVVGERIEPWEEDGKPFGRYKLLSELGRGAMGIVWRAWDTELRRIVALKMIRDQEGLDPELLERFQREARLAAKLRHPGIVAMYDVGVHDGQHFLTAEFIQGRTLGEAFSTSETLRQSVSWIQQVAEALHHAHREGVIHRDVKPGNVLVDRDGRPHVTDFGLAREVTASKVPGDPSARLTVTGAIMGTPHYMSPEQACGERDVVGPASDQFSVGVMLYEVLAGRPPFDGENAWDILSAVVNDDPVPPIRLRACVPMDLQTVCLKSLEKEPTRRYATLGDLAADLGAWLAGDPIRARPVGTMERVVRRVRRSPLVSSLVAGLVLSAIVVSGLQWKAARLERERVDGYLQDLALRGRAVVDAALARRAAGDLAGCEAYAHELDEPVRELASRAPDRAEPWYTKGRLERALGHEDEAEASQQEALRRARAENAPEGTRALLPLALYEHGVLWTQEYHRALEEGRQELVLALSAGLAAEGAAPAPQDDLSVERACPDVVDAKQRATGSLQEALAFDNGRTLGPRSAAARGMLALLEGRLDEAKADLERAVEADRYLTEAYLGLADLATKSGDWREAIRWHERGHRADRGFLPFLRGLAMCQWSLSLSEEASGRDGLEWRRRALATIAELDEIGAQDPMLSRHEALVWRCEADAALRRGRDPEEAAKTAEAAAEEATRLDPTAGAAWVLLAESWRVRGEWRQQHGQDPGDAYAKALSALDKAASLSTGSFSVEFGRLSVHRQLGEWREATGQDPCPDWDRALQAGRAALAMGPLESTAGNNLALVYLDLAEWRAGRGEDPGEPLEKGIAACDRALGLTPDLVEAIVTRGTLHHVRGDWRARQRHDPIAEYRAALADHTKALSLNPGLLAAANNIGAVHKELGDWVEAAGQDPTSEFERALEAYKVALSINPQNADAMNNRAVVLKRRGGWKAGRGEDPSDDFRAALEECERALGLRAGFVQALTNAGTVHRAWGDWMGGQKEDPSGQFRKAIEAYGKAIAIQPGNAVVWEDEGNAWWALGNWQARTNQDPRQAYGSAIEAFTRVLEASAGCPNAAYARGSVRQALGEWKRTHGEDPAADFEKSIEDMRAEAKLAPREFDPPFMEARAWWMLGVWRRNGGADGRAEFENAIAACDRALALDPSSGEANGVRGGVLEAMGRLDEAIAEYEQAERRSADPSWATRRLEGVRRAQRASAADAPEWLRKLGEAEALLAKRDLDGARAAYETAVQGFEADQPATIGDPVVKRMLLNSYYNLACFASIASASAEGASQRDRAFELLGRVCSLGGGNVAQFEGDRDLQALHTDPRWEELIRRAGQ